MAALVLLVPFTANLIALASAGNFYDDVALTWGDWRAQILNGGRDLTLSLDKFSASGFQSKNEYLFGRFDVKIKLIAGDSAGTVTTFYLSSQGVARDEIDLEFLGNVSGEPYTLHTNIYTQGQGNREQQFFLWFDPTSYFHTYSVVWNDKRILLLVDNIPIRVFNNNEAVGVPFPKSQPMRLYSSLWNADQWATQGGRVKTDWNKSPFTASYRDINIDANCVDSTSSFCGSKSSSSFGTHAWQKQKLDAAGRNRIRWVQQKFMIYNYCLDLKRFHQGRPQECRRPRF